MEHFFNLPVLYKNEELDLSGRLATFGYVYKFYIIIKGRELVFEKDDERNYRVILESKDQVKAVEADLLEAVIKALKHLSYE